MNVWLSVIKPLPDFFSTRFSALRVLAEMERRFTQDTRLHQLYLDFMRHEDLDHMISVDPAQSGRDLVSYLPHHGVMRETSISTKLRVVFNSSTITFAGNSLNGHLLVGPNLLPSFADILLRWRLHRFVLSTDVEKMFPQIVVHEDRDFQRII